MNDKTPTSDESFQPDNSEPIVNKFEWMPGDVIIDKTEPTDDSTDSSEVSPQGQRNAGSFGDEVKLSKLCFVFIDASIYYVDERGEHEGRLSDSCDQEEERSRLRTVCNSQDWIRASIVVGEQIIELARRAGDESAWGCTSGYFSGGASSGPNQMMSAIRSMTGHKPPSNGVGPLQRPSTGRWTVWRFTRYSRGQQFPRVGIWNLGHTMNPQFFPSWCHAISRDDGETVAILPDSPLMRNFARKWNAGELVPARQRWTGDRIPSFAGSTAYCRTRISGALQDNGVEIDGDLFAGALDFLQSHHQLKVSPFELVRDSLLHHEIERYKQQDIDNQTWTSKEHAKLRTLMKRFDRAKRVHLWFSDARDHAPSDLFGTEDLRSPRLEVELRSADRACRTGNISAVLYNSWTGWSGYPHSRENVPLVPPDSGSPGDYFAWYRHLFEMAAEHGLIENGWFDKRVKWHEHAFSTYPQEITEYQYCIRIVENSLNVKPVDRKLPPEDQLFISSKPAPGQLAGWYQEVFQFAEQLGLSSFDEQAGQVRE